MNIYHISIHLYTKCSLPYRLLGFLCVAGRGDFFCSVGAWMLSGPLSVAKELLNRLQSKWHEIILPGTLMGWQPIYVLHRMPRRQIPIFDNIWMFLKMSIGQGCLANLHQHSFLQLALNACNTSSVTNTAASNDLQPQLRAAVICRATSQAKTSHRVSCHERLLPTSVADLPVCPGGS